ncbi:OHCU decarboxylase domain-containing protein [Sarocladium implicatum]|nr:OHCU decarboxylase domain-containing protein [Sarocladium implicatum]
MSSASLPPISSLSSSPEATQIQTLDLLFEPSPAIHQTLLPIVRERVYASYPVLVEACYTQLLALAGPSTGETLLSVLGSHPRLGAKKVDSAQSAAEQANLQGQGEELAKLNQEYEAAFPGLRYVVFVNGRGRPEIMENMRSRIARGDYALEVEEALQAMRDIAKDRAAKLETSGNEQ